MSEQKKQLQEVKKLFYEEKDYQKAREMLKEIIINKKEEK